jgi:hypothetical protein
MENATEVRSNLAKIREAGGDAAIMVGLGLCTFFRMFISEDLGLSDEGAYFFRGSELANRVGIDFSFGPSYSWLYALATAFTGQDRVAAFFLGRGLGAVVFVLGMYVAFRLAGARRLAAAGLALLLVSLATPFVWPGVGGPSSAVLVLGLVVFFRNPTVVGASIASVLFWVAAAARPEFLTLGFVSTIFVLVFLARDQMGRRQVRPPLRSVLLGMGALSFVPFLVLLHGSPFKSSITDKTQTHPIQNRLLEAFAQHFSLRHSRAGESPWLDAPAIFKRTFGLADSIPAALSSNPSAFVGHVGANIRSIPRGLYGALIDGSGQFFFLSLVAIGSSVIFFVMLVLGLRFWFSTLDEPMSPKTEYARSLWRNQWAPIVLGFLMIACSLGAVVVIYPRSHYLVLWVSLGLVLVAYSWTKAPDSTYAVMEKSLLVLLIPLLFVSLVLDVDGGRANPHKAAKTISNLPADLKMLGGGDAGALYIYRPDISRITSPRLRSGESFCAYLNRSDASLIWMGDKALSGEKYSPAWVVQPGYQSFVRDPSTCGWRFFDPNSYFAVKVP